MSTSKKCLPVFRLLFIQILCMQRVCRHLKNAYVCSICCFIQILCLQRIYRYLKNAYVCSVCCLFKILNMYSICQYLKNAYLCFVCCLFKIRNMRMICSHLRNAYMCCACCVIQNPAYANIVYNLWDFCTKENLLSLNHVDGVSWRFLVLPCVQQAFRLWSFLLCVWF